MRTGCDKLRQATVTSYDTGLCHGCHKSRRVQTPHSSTEAAA
jgi:hypothetical protein